MLHNSTSDLNLASTTHSETNQTTKARAHNHCHNHYQYLFNCNRKTIWLIMNNEERVHCDGTQNNLDRLVAQLCEWNHWQQFSSR